MTEKLLTLKHSLLMVKYFSLPFLPGIFLTISFDWIHAEKFSLKQYVIVSICIILTCEVTYFSLEALELDPQWSFKLADRWCLKREWVHWDTTPFNAIFRDAGSILGE